MFSVSDGPGYKSLVLPLTGWVLSGKLFNFFELWFPHLGNGELQLLGPVTELSIAPKWGSKIVPLSEGHCEGSIGNILQGLAAGPSTAGAQPILTVFVIVEIAKTGYREARCR